MRIKSIVPPNKISNNELSPNLISRQAMLNILNDIDLTRLNTLHLRSIASHYVVLDKIEQLNELSDIISNYPTFFILGG
ncbi:MAG: hypothetical protein ACRC0B_04040, partial [Legionella sp.]